MDAVIEPARSANRPFVHQALDFPRFRRLMDAPAMHTGKLRYCRLLVVYARQHQLVNLPHLKGVRGVEPATSDSTQINRFFVINDLEMLTQAFTANRQPRFQDKLRSRSESVLPQWRSSYRSTRWLIAHPDGVQPQPAAA